MSEPPSMADDAYNEPDEPDDSIVVDVTIGVYPETGTIGCHCNSPSLLPTYLHLRGPAGPEAEALARFLRALGHRVSVVYVGAGSP